MSDQEEIRNLIARYSHCADDSDYEGYQSLFTRDGCLIENGVAVPRSRLPTLMRIYDKVKREQPQPFGGKHLQINTTIEVDGDRGRAVTDLLSVQLRPDTGWTIGGNGRYTDELAREDGRWRFRSRTVTWYGDFPAHPRDAAFTERLHDMIKEALSAEET